MIVGMSRRICVQMYNAIVKLRPEWASGANDGDTVAAVYDRRTLRALTPSAVSTAG